MRKNFTFAALALLILVGAKPPASAPARVGTAADGSQVVATGQTLRPAGDSLVIPSRPVDLTLSPDGKTIYLKDNEGVKAIDTAQWVLKESLSFPSGGGSMHGIAVSRDGRHLYATNAENLLAEAEIGKDGTLTWSRQIALPGPDGRGAADPCGIALSADGTRAYVCLSRNNSLGVVNLKSGALQSQIAVGIAPYDVVLSADGSRAYVSDWGGRRPKAGEAQALSSGTETLVDSRGVGASGCVSAVNVNVGRETAQVATGLHPSALAIRADGRTLYVANANSDTVSILAANPLRVVGTVSVHPLAKLLFGSAPTGVALSPDNGTLFVTEGGDNAVAVIALGKEGHRAEIQGFLPTGWYPGAVATDGRTIFIANVKGIGSRNKGSAEGYNSRQFSGTVQRVNIPAGAQLARFTAIVKAAVRRSALDTAVRAGAARPVPVPARLGEPSVFKHIVYVIKENRTYDQLFGDLAQGDGDKSLCVYGRAITPNHHALAEQFILLDNYYCNGVISADGHSWATEGNVTDHLEKSFGGFTRSYTFGDDPLTYSSSGFLWDDVLAHGRSFYNFGEMDYASVKSKEGYGEILRRSQKHLQQAAFTHSIGIARLRQHSDPTYPGWNLGIPDAARADIFLNALKGFEKKGKFPSLTIIYLPNDHTSGTAPGIPTPRAYLADNDLALGRIVAGISKSRFWPQTCIFVNEDDPQDGFDHVDGHRSLCLVVSPYTKRRTVSHQFYNQTAVLHTIERILGLPPMNQMDALAPLMTDCFTDKPTLTPYTCIPNVVPLGEMNPKLSLLHGKTRAWAALCERMDWSKPDDIPERQLNAILWHDRKGADTPYPALAAEQARRLRARGLKIRSRED